MNERVAGVAGLPAEVSGPLEALASELRVVLGEDLVALLAFGSAVRGGYVPGRSDVDLVLVMREATTPALLAISNVLQTARLASRFEAMILTEAEIPRAADVFPLLYDDIRRRHVVLAGRDPFSALHISDRHRRLRIEQELRDAQIRLRRAVVDGLGEPRAVAAALERKLKQLRGPMAALLTLKGHEVDDRLEPVLNEVGRVWQLDLEPLRRRADDPGAALEALMRLLAVLVDEVDEHGDESTR